MHLNIQGRHLTVTPSLHAYVKAKIKKVKYYFSHIVHAHVVLSVIKKDQTAEATITVEQHHFHNRITSDDMYKSIDTLFDKIVTGVRRYKETLQEAKTNRDKHHFTEVEETQQEHNILLEDREIVTKPMNDLEAILQLKLEKKETVLAYYRSENSNFPTFLVKRSEHIFDNYEYEGFWEKKEIEMIRPDRLQVNRVENVHIGTESIEHAVEYLEHNKVPFRLFKSVRTQKVMMVKHSSPGKYMLLREPLQIGT